MWRYTLSKFSLPQSNGPCTESHSSFLSGRGRCPPAISSLRGAKTTLEALQIPPKNWVFISLGPQDKLFPGINELWRAMWLESAHRQSSWGPGHLFQRWRRGSLEKVAVNGSLSACMNTGTLAIFQTLRRDDGRHAVRTAWSRKPARWGLPSQANFHALNSVSRSHTYS